MVKESFIRETLFEFDNEIDAFTKEQETVVIVSADPKSYNLASGGVGYTGLGQYVTERQIGIHALTFEERSAIQKERIANTPKEILSRNASVGGRIGGRVGVERKSGIHGLSKEERVINAKKGNDGAKAKGVGRFNPLTQAELGRRGGPKNKGFKWYSSESQDFKYTTKEQMELSFEYFIKTNPQYTAGRCPRIFKLNK